MSKSGHGLAASASPREWTQASTPLQPDPMKQLHRPDLWAWSSFDEARNIDFNSVAWIRDGGNVLIDPLPMRDHDLSHVESLGGAATIVITTSDHMRASAELAARFEAELVGPVGERDGFPLACDRFLGDGDLVVPGLQALALDGSKTPGELALVLAEQTLITGDLIRGQVAGALNLLPEKKLTDGAAATASVQRLLEFGALDTVLVGDGWHVFYDGHGALSRLCAAVR